MLARVQDEVLALHRVGDSLTQKPVASRHGFYHQLPEETPTRAEDSSAARPEVTFTSMRLGFCSGL
jgi:hypothetical protein